MPLIQRPTNPIRESSFTNTLRAAAIALTGIGASTANVSAQSTDRVDVQRQDRQRVQMTETLDGTVFGVIGQENQNPGNPQNPMYVVLGVGSDPLRTFDGAIILSQATGRAVYPIMNASDVAEARNLWEKRFVFQTSLLDKVSPWLGSEFRSMTEGAADVNGKLNDIARATSDRILPAGLAFEPSTKSLRDQLLLDVAAGKRVDVVAHSQGTVIAQNSVTLLANDLGAMVKRGELSEHDRTEYLSLIRVLSTGAYAAPDKWPTGITVRNLNNPDDVVPKVGGSLPTVRWSELDFSLKSHNFDDYVRWVAAELKGEAWCGPSAPSNVKAKAVSEPPTASSLTEAEKSLLESAKSQATVRELAKRVLAGGEGFENGLKKERQDLDQIVSTLGKLLDDSPELKKQLMPIIQRQAALAKEGKSIADLSPAERATYEAAVNHMRTKLDGEFKKAREDTYKVIRKVRDRDYDAAALAEIQRGLALTAEGADALVSVVAAFDGKLAREMEIIFTSSMQIATGIARCLAADYSGAFSIAKGIASLVGLKTVDVGAERHREIMETLFTIREEIAEVHYEIVELRRDLHQLRQEMHEGFGGLDERLFQMQGELRQTFLLTFDSLQNLRFDLIQARFRDEELKDLVQFFGMRTSEAIAGLYVDELLDGIQLAFRERPTVSIDNTDGTGAAAQQAVELTPREIETLLLRFHRHATRTASNPLMNGSDFKLTNLSSSGVKAELLESLPLARRFGFLGELYSDGLLEPIPRGLSNPTEYVLGAQAYLTLRGRNPHYNDDNLGDLDQMIEIGEQLLAASKSLSSPELLVDQVHRYRDSVFNFRAHVVKEIVEAVEQTARRPQPNAIKLVEGKHIFDWHSAALSSTTWEQKEAVVPYAISSRESAKLSIKVEQLPAEVRLLLENKRATLTTAFSAEGFFTIVPPKKALEHGKQGPGYKGPMNPVVTHTVSFTLLEHSVTKEKRETQVYKKTVDTNSKDLMRRYTTKGKEVEVTEYEHNGKKSRTYLQAPEYVPPWHFTVMSNTAAFAQVWEGKLDYIIKRPISEWGGYGVALSPRWPDGSNRNYSKAELKKISDAQRKGAEERRLNYLKNCFKEHGLRQVFETQAKVEWSKEAVDKAAQVNRAHYVEREKEVRASVKGIIPLSNEGMEILNSATYCAARVETLAELFWNSGVAFPPLDRRLELVGVLSEPTVQDVLKALDELVDKLDTLKMEVNAFAKARSSISAQKDFESNFGEINRTVTALKKFREFEAARLAEK